MKEHEEEMTSWAALSVLQPTNSCSLGFAALFFWLFLCILVLLEGIHCARLRLCLMYLMISHGRKL